MIPSSVVFVDTSIIVRLIGMMGPAKAEEIDTEFRRRREAGQRFVLPVTALIEAGNLVERQSNNRRVHAARLHSLIEAASRPDPPWIVREVSLGQEFVDELLAGDSTGSDLVALLADGRLGTGDVALLVERDQYKRQTAHERVEVWTLDAELSAHG